MNLEQLGKLPSTVHESDCKQAFGPPIPLSISNEEGVLSEFCTPGDDSGDESGVERVGCLGDTPGGAGVNGTDQIVTG